MVGSVAGRSVAFLPRHGRDHRFPPHRVNYRANLWALRALGVRQVLAPSAVGSMLPELGPGSLVVPDQIIDRTWGREHTIFGGDDGPVVHVSFADPYCPRGRAAVGAGGHGGGVARSGGRHARRHQRAAVLEPGRVHGGTRRPAGTSSA